MYNLLYVLSSSTVKPGHFQPHQIIVMVWFYSVYHFTWKNTFKERLDTSINTTFTAKTQAIFIT